MPRGDTAEAPPIPRYNATWTLGKPDLILTIQHPATLPASGSDIFLNFVLPYPLDQTHYIRAMEIRPGTPQVVHHANVLIDRTASWRRAHPDTWRDGVPGMELMVDAGNTFDPDSHFLFWKPDTPALVEAPGMPWRLDPGNDLILNMHLKPSGKPETIAAQIGLYFTTSLPRSSPCCCNSNTTPRSIFPPGKSDFIIEDELKLPVDVDVLGSIRMPTISARTCRVMRSCPTAKAVAHLDPQLGHRSPVRLPISQARLSARGTTIHMRYIYDNSSENVHNPNDPPIRVRAGNRSVDEMGHLWLQVLPVNIPPNSPDPRLLLETAWMQDRLRKAPRYPRPLQSRRRADHRGQVL